MTRPLMSVTSIPGIDQIPRSIVFDCEKVGEGWNEQDGFHSEDPAFGEYKSILARGLGDEYHTFLMVSIISQASCASISRPSSLAERNKSASSVTTSLPGLPRSKQWNSRLSTNKVIQY